MEELVPSSFFKKGIRIKIFKFSKKTSTIEKKIRKEKWLAVPLGTFVALLCSGVKKIFSDDESENF